MRRVVLVTVAVLAAGCSAARPTPRRVPALVQPEIIVSLQGLTVHLFDRTTGASWVYAASPGMIGADGRSVTPVGHFRTGPDPRNSWWYQPRRVEPAEFGGLPFLRLTAVNRRGEQVYGLHGPTTEPAPHPGLVSRGCVRLAEPDILELFALVRRQPSIPVTIQDELELDAAGTPVVVGASPVLWPRDAEITYGDSVGPRASRRSAKLDEARRQAPDRVIVPPRSSRGARITGRARRPGSDAPAPTACERARW